MSNIWKIAIALTLVLCLIVMFIACDNDDEPGELYITDSEEQTEKEAELNIPLGDDEEGEDYGKMVTPTNKK